MDINLSIAVHALLMHILASLSVDEILLLRYINWFTNFCGNISSSSSHAASTDFSLAIQTNHPSLPVGLLDYILCPYRAVVCMFFLVDQHWRTHVNGSIGKCHL